MHRLWLTWGSAILMSGVVAAAAGCGGSSATDPNPVTTGSGGSGGGGAPGPVQTTSGPYEPLAVGTTWTYHVNDNGVVYDKTSTVESMEDAGGMFAGVTVFRVHDHFPAEDQNTWYQVDGLAVKRLHDDAHTGATLKSDDWYSPYRLRVDETPEHMTAGASWSMMYMDIATKPPKPAMTTSQTDGWKVEGVDEVITVPLGTYQSLHLTRVDPIDSSTKSFWFVRGIGKVKEQTSGGHREELSAHTSAP